MAIDNGAIETFLLSRKFQWGLKKNHTKIVAKRNINIVTPRRSKYEFAECDNATMLRRGGLPLFIGLCGVRLIVVRSTNAILTYQCGSINK